MRRAAFKGSYICSSIVCRLPDVQRVPFGSVQARLQVRPVRRIGKDRLVSSRRMQLLVGSSNLSGAGDTVPDDDTQPRPIATGSGLRSPG